MGGGNNRIGRWLRLAAIIAILGYLAASFYFDDGKLPPSTMQAPR